MEIQNCLTTLSTLVMLLQLTYFCSDIPPAQPTVIDEVEAEDGSVIIETIVDPDDASSFLHTISLSGISFVTDSGERITNIAISEFGEVTTNVPD